MTPNNNDTRTQPNKDHVVQMNYLQVDNVYHTVFQVEW